MSYSYAESLTGEDAARYKSKLSMVGLLECPFKIARDCWRNDPYSWPDITYPDIYHYLIESPGVHFKRQSMKNYRSLEAYNYFVSGWVQTVYSFKPDASLYTVLQTDVKPSWRVKDATHSAWLAVEENGTIITAHCTCKAGLGESCSHVAAVMFKIEAAVRLGITKQACTSQACKWNDFFVKDVQPKMITDIKFYSAKAKSKLSKESPKGATCTPTATKEEQTMLLDLLNQKDSPGICFSTFNNYASNFFWERPPTIDEGYPAPLKEIIKSKIPLQEFHITEGQIDALEKATITQSDSLLWHQQRIGRVTASKAHKVLHTNMEKPSKSLLQENCNPSVTQLRVPAVMWGKEHEKDALGAYQHVFCHDANESIALPQGEYILGSTFKVHHMNATIFKAGLRLSALEAWIGASEDGYIMCDCCGKGVIEIKHPLKFSEEGMTFPKYVNDKGCHLHPDGTLKETHQYYTQVQMQMHVCKAMHCHFITWSLQDFVMSLVPRNEEFIERMLSAIKLFWDTHVYPALLHDEVQMAKDTSVYWKCQTDKPGEEMVGCDNANCQFKWFHFTCVGLKTKPRKNTL